jgi:HEPN domain-containing protein
MTIDEQIQYWIDIAENDLPVAEHLFEKGDNVWCLFIAHLILEKILKAVYVRDNHSIPPKTHDLLRLAKSTKLQLSKDQEEFLNTVNDFNIESRYPDYKQQFYKVCTKEYTEENFNKVKEMYQWIKYQLK